MKKTKIKTPTLFLLFLLIIIHSYFLNAVSFNIETVKKNSKKLIQSFLLNEKLEFLKKEPRILIDLVALFLSYPDFCKHIQADNDKNIYIVMDDGSKFIYDDKIIKNFDEKIKSPDLQDMLEQIYPVKFYNDKKTMNFDPGRIRVEGFFKSIYGKTKSEVNKNCITVKVLNKRLSFNKRNNISEIMRKLNLKLIELIKEHPLYEKYIIPFGGSLKWRFISGTKRLSSHSFGIAIDLNPKRGIYWKWMKSKTDILKYISKYPKEIVLIFENAGFIWGGKWAHYDLMHFEYRPELFLKRILQNIYFNKEK